MNRPIGRIVTNPRRLMGGPRPRSRRLHIRGFRWAFGTILTLMLALPGRVRGEPPPGALQFFSSPSVHNLYLRNVDGNLFRWGEARYGNYADSPSPVRVPYYDRVTAIPPSPSGASWRSATGGGIDEAFLDEDGNAYATRFIWNLPTRLHRIGHPDVDGRWGMVAMGNWELLLIDEAGALYKLNLGAFLTAAEEGEGNGETEAGDWLSLVDTPVEVGPVSSVAGRQGSTLVLSRNGELYGLGWGPLVGSEAVPGSDWQRLVRPPEVNRWVSLQTSDMAAIAVGDDGGVYYWGLRLPESEVADVSADPRVPVIIPPAEGSTGWNSATIVQGLVMLVSREGQLYRFGVSLFPLSQISGDASYLEFPAATAFPFPWSSESFVSIQSGADYLLGQLADGTVLHWGQFMSLEANSSPGTLEPSPMPVPEYVWDEPARMAPAVRLLEPADGLQTGVDQPLRLLGEVFVYDGTLESAEFVVDGLAAGASSTVTDSVVESTWQPSLPGIHELVLVATDSMGRTSTSEPVHFTTLQSVDWSLSTQRIEEPLVPGAGIPAMLTLVRSHPYDTPFLFRFFVAPRSQLNVDFTIDGAVMTSDGSGQMEVEFLPGQISRTVTLTPLADDFTDTEMVVQLLVADDFAREKRYVPPRETLELTITDTTVTGASSLAYIVGGGMPQYVFSGDEAMITVFVSRALAAQPQVQLLSNGSGISYREVSREVLEDRVLVNFAVPGLWVGNHEIYARVRDGWWEYWNRYRDTAPTVIKVLDRAALPKLAVVAGQHVLNEWDGESATVTVAREGGVDLPVEVDLNYRGTALPGSDYSPGPEHVTIPAGASYVQFSLQALPDTRPELDEVVIVSAVQRPCIELEGCYVVNQESAFRVEIRDDDPAPATPEGGARVVASPFAEVSFLLTASGRLFAWGDDRAAVLGVGPIPVELAGRVPWPREVEMPAAPGRWSDVLPADTTAFGLADDGTVYAWGGALSAVGGQGPLRTPEPMAPIADGTRPWFGWNGLLVGRQDDGRLRKFRVASDLPRRFVLQSPAGMVALRTTAQRRSLGEDGYFHSVDDWDGRYPEKYPLAPGAGYWTDVAVSGNRIIARDELGRLFDVEAGPLEFDPVTRRTVLSYRTALRPDLPGGRAVFRLLGNELGILAWTQDGLAFALDPLIAAAPEEGAAVVGFPEGVTRWTSMAAGARHFLAVGDDGMVYSWGDNETGQLGNGTFESEAGPQRLPALTGVNDPDESSPLLKLSLAPRLEWVDMPEAFYLEGPGHVSAEVHAFDPDGSLTQVAFLLDGEVAAVADYRASTGTFQADVPLPNPGQFALTARAWDDEYHFSDTALIAVEVDDPGLHPIVKVWNIPSGTAEGFGVPGFFHISRQGIANVPLTVHFAITGTATEGVDYPALPRSVVIPAGAAEVSIPVIARPDFIYEPTEEVLLTILNPGCDPATAEPGSGCYAIGSPSAAPVFLIDYLVPGDAYLPFVWMNVLQPITREGSTQVGRLEVLRKGTMLEPLVVNYQWTGTAENGVDFAPLSGVAVIPAGADRTTITVAAIQDFVSEPWEQVTFSLVDPGCGPGGSGSAEGCFRLDPQQRATIYVGEETVSPPPPPGLSVVPQPTLFEGIEWVPGQGTYLKVVSDPGVRFLLLTSPDLKTWRSLGEWTSVSGRMEFLDVDAANDPVRYYRVAPPPPPD